MLFTALNIREAEPGEFTKIAVINNKQALNEAESLFDLINSTTEAEMSTSSRCNYWQVVKCVISPR